MGKNIVVKLVLPTTCSCCQSILCISNSISAYVLLGRRLVVQFESQNLQVLASTHVLPIIYTLICIPLYGIL